VRRSNRARHPRLRKPTGGAGRPGPLEGLEDVLKRLEHVSEARADPTGNVVAVSFEGGRAEQQEIERAIEEAGYEVSRLSVRSDFPRK
jgi:copper chaperone CopZ